MLQRRIELCGDAPRAPMQPCKRQARPRTGPQGGPLPEQVKSEKSQGVGGTESPDSFDDTVKKTEHYVSVFSGEVQSISTLLNRSAQRPHNGHADDCTIGRSDL